MRLETYTELHIAELKTYFLENVYEQPSLKVRWFSLSRRLFWSYSGQVIYRKARILLLVNKYRSLKFLRRLCWLVAFRPIASVVLVPIKVHPAFDHIVVKELGCITNLNLLPIKRNLLRASDFEVQPSPFDVFRRLLFHRL